jgi:hypothetical protein
VALLGQLSHEHAPGAQEQTSPHLFISYYPQRGEGGKGEIKKIKKREGEGEMTYEQADFPLSVDFLGQFSQLHWPGLHEQPDSQLLISPAPPLLIREQNLLAS